VLGDDDLHVWRSSLDLPDTRVKRLRQILSLDERARADRFHFQLDRQRFITARGCLRIILAQYVASCPSEIRFSYGPYGKPSAANTSALAGELRFNLAHAGGLALYPMTRRCEIGVDLEKVRADFAADQIA